ncbi:MAG TPA: substrate-binding domain-containing protein [Geothrix sp.]
MRHLALSLIVCSALLGQGVVQYAPKVDPGFQGYAPAAQAEGIVESVGADSLADVWEEWRFAFKKVQPKAQFKVTHQPVSQALKAFLEGNSGLLHLPREMKVEEAQAFQKKFGYQPTKLVVCYDAFIVFVNAANPIKDMGMDQLDAAYSTTRLSGYRPEAPTETWGDLGVRNGDYVRRPISAYMRAEGLASRATIQEMVLLKGKYKPTVIECPDWSGIAEAVMTDASGLGIGTLASWLSRNKTLALTPLHAKEAVAPNQENVVSGRYPLSRTYYLYVNRAPGKDLPPAVAEFLSFVLSREGQAAVAQAMLYPLPMEIAQMNRKRLRTN